MIRRQCRNVAKAFACWVGLCSALSACHARVISAPEDSRAELDAESCGDGVVSAVEECDPTVPGWEDGCDASCTRTQFRACDLERGCEAPVNMCVSYTESEDQRFCARECDENSDCPVLPGFASACNFAWCAVLCDDGSCPLGMICVEGFPFLDREGRGLGPHDVCVIEASSDGSWESRS